MFCRSLFVPFLLAIVLSVRLRFTDSDYPFGIFKLFLVFRYCLNKLLYVSTCTEKHPIQQVIYNPSWFSPGTPVSSTNKTDRHDITEILLKVALSTINETKPKPTIL
jgi:hypothetical protein